MPWGFVVAAISSIQGALYLLVLSVNSLVTIHRGVVDPPGELPVWATLTMAMTAVALALLANIRPECAAFWKRRASRSLVRRRKGGVNENILHSVSSRAGPRHG